MIEKLGHSKRIQVMRRQLIDEGRPGYHLENDGFDQQKTYSVTIVEGTSAALNQTPDPHGPSAATGEQHSPRVEDSMQSMEIDAPTSLERDTTERRREGDDGKLFMSDDEGGGNDVGKDAGDEDVPEEDELDALLAEHEMKEDEQLHHESTTSIVVKERAPEESFEDDLEAMADSNTPW
jgi:replication fork protection complex subunit Csm3/Swi3